MRLLRTLALVAAGLAGGEISPRLAAAAGGPPVLLVHGLSWAVDGDDATWGRATVDSEGQVHIGGMVGFLDQRGLPYGGTIRPAGGRVQMPDSLDTYGANVEPQAARLFVLKFSCCANTDGLAYKALELAEAIRQIRHLTGAAKVTVVAHSAGGLVARAYLQNALPGVPYRGDIDRLVTIATPHLGSAMASHFGDFLGARATSLKPDASLIRQLNSTLDLPSDTTFASIVVRGIAADGRGEGHEYDELIDREFLAHLPIEYRVGGDQVVHVRSQNLRLAPCAARYEAATGRPVQYVLARVPDPSPDDHCFLDVNVHVVCAGDPTVETLVFGLIQPGALLWSHVRSEQLNGWIDWQARLHTNGIIEEAALHEHPLSQVSNVEIDDFKLLSEGDFQRRTYSFDGRAFSHNMLISLRRRWTHVVGRLDLQFDAFGRVLSAQSNLD